MENFVKLSLIYVLVVFFSVNASKTPIYIEEILADANKTSSSPYKAQDSTYDYIIVGAGAAGCVIANRISASPDITVLLLEAGGPERLAHQMPALSNGLLGSNTNYGYTTIPQKHSCFGMNDNICDAAQGRSAGGSTSFSSMIYNRGHRQSYDDWAAAGNDGWTYDDVLPYFLRAENSSLSNYQKSPYHNYSGSYVSTEDLKYRSSIAPALIQSCAQSGLKYIDYNDANSKEGCSYTQATTLNGRRHSAFKAYIEPIQADRHNLNVLLYSMVTKVLIDSETKTAYGVDFEHLGEKSTVKANKEVILSAGAIHSAQLLMVSGVGPKRILENIGVPALVNLPVGETLYDDVGHFGPIFTTNTTMNTTFIDLITETDIKQFLNGDPSTRVSSISNYEASVFVRSNHSKDVESEILMIAGSVSVDYGTTFKKALNMRDDVYNAIFKPTEGIDHFSLLVAAARPKSKGSMWVESSDVKVPPKIDPNHYSRQEDVELTLEGIKEGLRIISSPAMQAINATLLTTKVPGCEHLKFGIDEYWRCSIRVLSIPRHHYVGPCKMGPKSDKTTVVDSNLKVHGVEGLRVADTCVIPVTVSGHTESVGNMIGEMASSKIMAENAKACRFRK